MSSYEDLKLGSSDLRIQITCAVSMEAEAMQTALVGGEEVSKPCSKISVSEEETIYTFNK